MPVIEVAESETSVFLVLEYINGGDLEQILSYFTGLLRRETVIRKIVGQLTIALASLHSRNIVHRDLKLSNIMIQFLNEEEFDEGIPF